MDVSAYLGRIAYKKRIETDLDTLRALHSAHMQTVPFENLDIGRKRPIRLDERALWEKIILNKRGGFCYELNGLFSSLLKHIGFEVTHLNARVFNRQGNLGMDFDHLALLVRIPGRSDRWLADVGFGDSFTEPLRFEGHDEQLQGLRSYRLEQTSDGYIVWQRNYDETWERQYFFDMQPHRFPEEYESACFYHQTSPESSFTRGSIVSRLSGTGRVTLENDRLILTWNGQREESPVQNEEEFRLFLKRHFDISLPEENI